MTESIHYTKKIRHQIDDDFGNQLRTPGFTFLWILGKQFRFFYSKASQEASSSLPCFLVSKAGNALMI